MLVRRIYEWAHAMPEKTAIVYNGMPFSYRAFALRIEHARQAVSRHPPRQGGIAVVHTVGLIDTWVICLAMRSLGMTTIAVPSLDSLNGLGLKDLACIVTDMPAGKPVRRPPDCFVAWIRRGLYLREAADELPDPKRMTILPGGHLILTSGTTGTNKTALIDDAIAAIRQPLLARQCGFDERSVVCLFGFGMWTAPGMIAATVWDVGGTVVLEQRPDLYLCLADNAVTYAHAAPGILSQLLATAPRDALRPRDTLSIGVGGGALSPALAEEVRARLTPNLFVHVASTEVGIWCITRIETAEDLRSHCIVPGREVRVVDEAERPVPPGQLGQIRIRVIDGFTGYRGNEAASRASFRNGFFYPGDLGYFLENGRLVLQGRVTDVVNIQGNKVAPEPVERALRERLGVEEVCLVSLAATGAPEDLHVAIQSQQSIDPAALAAAWSATMRTAPQPRFHLVKSLPRNEAGKLQRFALRERISRGGPL
jgi:acyl-coenzyme A synthetase/AMP-(fatty) acid ligase